MQTDVTDLYGSLLEDNLISIASDTIVKATVDINLLSTVMQAEYKVMKETYKNGDAARNSYNDTIINLRMVDGTLDTIKETGEKIVDNIKNADPIDIPSGSWDYYYLYNK